jgi:hypothetical protein
MNQWRQAHGARNKKRGILSYNRSNYYANTMYNLACRLKDAKNVNGSRPARARPAPLRRTELALPLSDQSPRSPLLTHPQILW